MSLQSIPRVISRRSHTPLFHSSLLLQTKRWSSTTYLGEETVKLTYDVARASHASHTKRKLVLCHGLFGSKQNFRSLSRQFAKRLGMDVYCVDLRNHGTSPHSTNMTYTAMAADLLRFMEHISDTGNEQVSLLGHSMGGKVVMTLALHPQTPPHLLHNLIVEDISPIQGRLSPEFTEYAKAMMRIMENKYKHRKQADELLKEVEPDITVRQFLLTNVSASSTPGAPLSFRVPPQIIVDSMSKLGDFAFKKDDTVKFEKPTLVIRGSKSHFIKDSKLPLFDHFFPNNEVVTLNTGHWVHAEDPAGFTETVVSFLEARK